MPKSWATFDLHLELHGLRGRAGLERALRDAVRGRRLHPGTRLPSSRSLAADLGIARNTVAEAYTQLVAEGWLEARPGSGTWVATGVGRRRAPRRIAGSGTGPVRYDLRPGSPDVSSFPRTVWTAAARRALTNAAHADLGYGDVRGLLALRRELAGYLARVRGVVAEPDHLVVCAGAVQGLALMASVLRRRGVRAVAIEEDGHRLHRDVLAATSVDVRAVPVDGAGAQVERFGDAGAALLTPAHQFPHGVPLAPARRAAALRWAVERDAVLIEDDYDGEFRYDRQSVGAVQALDPDHVVYAGTASKTLAPGVRLGWLVVPPRLLDDVVRAKELGCGMHGALDQLTFAELLRTGAYDRHVRSRRLAYRRRREHLLAALAEQAPDVRVRGVPAGLHAMLTLPPRLSEAEVLRRAGEHGLALGAFSSYRLSRRPVRTPAVVVSFGTPPDHAFTGAVARLCAVLRA